MFLELLNGQSGVALGVVGVAYVNGCVLNGSKLGGREEY